MKQNQETLIPPSDSPKPETEVKDKPATIPETPETAAPSGPKEPESDKTSGKTDDAKTETPDENSPDASTDKPPQKAVKKPLFYVGKLIRSICFLLITALILAGFSFILEPKNNSKKNGMANENSVGFYSEKDGNIDVFLMGNSNTYAGFSPLEMWHDYGLTSYASGVAYERVVEAYYMIKDVLRYHHPKLFVLETDCIFTGKKNTDQITLALEKSINYEIPLFNYHNHWKTVYFPEMFTLPDYRWHSYSHGQYINVNSEPYPGKMDLTPTQQRAEIDWITRFYLNAIVSLCESNQIPLLFVYVPCADAWTYPKHNAIQDYADEKNIPFLDLNLIQDELGIDWQTDTRDKGTHLNVFGAKKISKYIGSYLMEHYPLKDHRKEKKLAKVWKKDYKLYQSKIAEKL